jgi:hypothetical protein
MVKVSGDAIIRAGSEDFKEWQFLQADSVTPISLEAAAKVTIRLKEEPTGAVTEYNTVDDPTKIEMLVPLSQGIVRLMPAADTFPSASRYIFHFILETATGKKIPIPEDHNEALTVIDDYAPPPPP